MHAEIDADQIHQSENGCLWNPEGASKHRVCLLYGEAVVDGRLERPLDEIYTEPIADESGGIVAHYHSLSESLVGKRAQALGH